MFTSINLATGAAGVGMKVAEAAGRALKKVERQQFERGITAGMTAVSAMLASSPGAPSAASSDRATAVSWDHTACASS